MAVTFIAHPAHPAAHLFARPVPKLQLLPNVEQALEAASIPSSSSSAALLPPPLRRLPAPLRDELEELLHLVEVLVVLEAGEISRPELEKAVQDMVGAVQDTCCRTVAGYTLEGQVQGCM